MMQPIYINHIASIHPNGELVKGEKGQPYFLASEPNYKQAIAYPTLRRRMSRIVKMGVACGLQCLENEEATKVDAIITATGLGCLAETEKFLASLINSNEQMITPTPFIQSTFNTIGAQIALIQDIHAYNMTYVHRGLSFESALIDSLMQIAEGKEQVLLGAIDEITPTSHTIQQRLGLLKANVVAGEGAQFFLLGRTPTTSHAPAISDVDTFIGMYGVDQIEQRIKKFFERNNLQSNNVDCLVTGKNGLYAQDAIYAAIEQKLFPQAALRTFKDTCGEYPTATAYALFQVAENCLKESKPGKVTLIYNQYQTVNHSLILIQE